MPKFTRKMMITVDKEGHILTEDYIEKLMQLYLHRNSADIGFTLVDGEGAVDELDNIVLNHFLKALLRTCPVECYLTGYLKDGEMETFAEYIEQFLIHYYASLHRRSLMNDKDYVGLDIFYPNASRTPNTRIYVKREVLGDKCKELMNIGPDYLYAFLDMRTEFTVVLPAFLRMVAEQGLLDDPDLGSASKYMIGLA